MIITIQKAGLLAASLSQSMVALFASYSALGGFGLGACSSFNDPYPDPVV